MITLAQMSRAMPVAAAAGRLAVWYGPLTANMAAYDIVTVPRQCQFLAIQAQETQEFAAREENLRYSGARLREVYPIFFDNNPDLADQLAAQGPVAIANYIYDDANRPRGYKLGNTAPGDGWKHRGRGPGQLTGKGNYERFFVSIGLPADTDPDEILKPEVGAKSSCHFWKTRGCNEMADNGNFDQVVYTWNGGHHGMSERRRYLAALQSALAGG